jgi:hypothetical protein
VNDQLIDTDSASNTGTAVGSSANITVRTIYSCSNRRVFARIKSSLLMKNVLQNKQTLQLFTEIIKTKLFTKVINLPSWKAWVYRPAGLIKRGRKHKLSRDERSKCPKLFSSITVI